MDKIAEMIAIFMNMILNGIANIRDFILALMGRIEYQGVIA